MNKRKQFCKTSYVEDISDLAISLIRISPDFYPDEVAHLYLSSVVHDEFVCTHATFSKFLNLPAWNQDVAEMFRLCWDWSFYTKGMCTVES